MDKPRKLRFGCRVCGGEFELRPRQARYYCPYCGTFAVELRKEKEEARDGNQKENR